MSKMMLFQVKIIYFRLRIWWRHSFRNVEIYPHIKFRWDVLIHSRVITRTRHSPQHHNLCLRNSTFTLRYKFSIYYKFVIVTDLVYIQHQTDKN